MIHPWTIYFYLIHAGISIYFVYHMYSTYNLTSSKELTAIVFCSIGIQFCGPS